MRTFWTTADLRARGRSPREIRRAVDPGRIGVVRPGRFAEPDADAQLVRAVRVGGLATAHTAARSLGLWTPPDAGVRRMRDEPHVLHVAVRATASIPRLRHPDHGDRPFLPGPEVILHWTSPSLLAPVTHTGRVDLLTMLEHLFLGEQPERALAVLDSALHERHLRVTDLHVLAARLPAHLRPVVFAADPRAESGIETIARYLLRLLGLRVDVQVRIPGVGQVDLLVAGRLIVECDGREWHDDEAAFDRDRTRDLAAAAGRYRTLRLTWYRVLFQWRSVEEAVLAALAA